MTIMKYSLALRRTDVESLRDTAVTQEKCAPDERRGSVKTSQDLLAVIKL